MSDREICLSGADVAVSRKTKKGDTMARKTFKPKSTFTKKITRGPNKGDRVAFKVASGGKPFPTRVLNDKGSNSTLKNNPGVKFGKKAKSKSKTKKKK